MRKIIFTMLFAACIASSCEHKELCFDHRHCRIPVTVVFDWVNAPEADPASMSLFLYPQDGGQPLRYEFAGRDGGDIMIPVGHYNAVCVNSDTESALFREMNLLETFQIRTRETDMFSELGIRSEGAPRADGTESERIVSTPEMLWTARTDDIELVLPQPHDDAPADGGQTIVFYPAEAVCHYSVEIRNADNLQYISALSGSLSGMSGGLMVASSTPTPDKATMPFGAQSDGEIITGSWLTFGHCPTIADPDVSSDSDQAKHKLIIYAVMTNGEKWYYTYDVTEQIHTAADPRHVHLLLDGLPLPQPSSGGGFHPDIEDWNVVHIEIEL